MIIRKANQEDANPITNYLLLAMEAIVYEFIGQKDPITAREFLHHFVKQEANQYSYQNCLVVEDEGEIVAAVNIYDGSKLKQLRAPIAQYIKTQFLKDFNPTDETQEGEFYIDTLGVHPNQQGKGIGAKLLRHVINYYVYENKQAVGLLVDEDNLNAQRLYLKLGFEPVGELVLEGKHMIHLQIKPKTS